MAGNRKAGATRASRALQGALLELLKDRPFEKITVEQVTAQAGYCKNTFYVHYPNMVALLQDCYLSKLPQMPEDAIVPLFGMGSGDAPGLRDALWRSLDYTAALVSVFKENPNLARVVINQMGISPYFSEQYESQIAIDVSLLSQGFDAPARNYLTFEECAHVTEDCAFSVYRHWLRQGMRNSPERVAKSVVYYTTCLLVACGGQAVAPEVLAWIDEWEWEDARL